MELVSGLGAPEDGNRRAVRLDAARLGAVDDLPPLVLDRLREQHLLGLLARVEAAHESFEEGLGLRCLRLRRKGQGRVEEVVEEEVVVVEEVVEEVEEEVEEDV